MKDNSVIPVGTPCFLTKLGERPWLDGRVVEVIAGPQSVENEVGDDWYKVSSTWIDQEFKDCEAQARRGNLRPIVPPPIATPAPPITEEITQ